MSVKITEDQVEAIFIDREEYMRQLDNDIARLKAAESLREQELVARAKALELSQAEAQQLLAAQLQAMHHAHKQQMEAMIQERLRQINAENEAGRRAVEEIRRKAEEIRKAEEVKMQQMRTAHEAALARIQGKRDQESQQNKTRMAEIERQALEWEQRRRVQTEQEDLARAQDRAAAALQREQAKRRADEEEKVAQVNFERQQTEQQDAHAKKMQALQERLKQLQARQMHDSETCESSEHFASSHSALRTLDPATTANEQDTVPAYPSERDEQKYSQQAWQQSSIPRPSARQETQLQEDGRLHGSRPFISSTHQRGMALSAGEQRKNQRSQPLNYQ